MNTETKEPRTVSLRDYPRENLQPTDLVYTTFGNYKNYGEQVFERISEKMLAILKALSDTIERYEPAENAPATVGFTIPVAAWDKFYRGHIHLEESLTRILQDVTEGRVTDRTILHELLDQHLSDIAMQ